MWTPLPAPRSKNHSKNLTTGAAGARAPSAAAAAAPALAPTSQGRRSQGFKPYGRGILEEKKGEKGKKNHKKTKEKNF